MEYKELKNAYKEAVHYMDVNESLAFQRRPEKATWIDNRVLVKWIYESSKEWLASFKKTAKEFDGRDEEKASRCECLELKLNGFKNLIQTQLGIKLG